MLPVMLFSGLLASMPVPATEVGVTAGDWAQLERGDVAARTEMTRNAAGEDTGRGVALAIVEAPATRVMDTVWAYERHPEFMPRVERMDVLAGEDAPIHKRVAVTLGVLWKRVRYTLDVRRDAERNEIRWALDKAAAHDIVDTTGVWRFVPLGAARTLVAYEVRIDTGIAVPRALQEFFTQRDLPGLLAAVKKRIESGDTWRK